MSKPFGWRLTNLVNPAASAACTIAESSAYGARWRCSRAAYRRQRRILANKPTFAAGRPDRAGAGRCRRCARRRRSAGRGRASACNVVLPDPVRPRITRAHRHDAQGNVLRRRLRFYGSSSTLRNSISPVSWTMHEGRVVRAFDPAARHQLIQRFERKARALELRSAGRPPAPAARSRARRASSRRSARPSTACALR